MRKAFIFYVIRDKQTYSKYKITQYIFLTKYLQHCTNKHMKKYIFNSEIQRHYELTQGTRSVKQLA